MVSQEPNCLSERRLLSFQLALKMTKLLLILVLLCCVGLPDLAYAQQRHAGYRLRNEIIEHGPFIQIPGPNPLISPGESSDWDGAVVEAGNVIKDENTYYFYYHGATRDRNKWPRGGYRIGVASAPHPLGPWKKHDANPIIDLGPEGSWKGLHVACPAVIKEEGNKYYMWFGGMKDDSGEFGRWDIALATASNPLGPWTEYEGNPVVLEDFGFVGGVVKVDGKYMMYNVHPIGSESPDSGPIKLATAEKPEGPWRKYEGNPVIPGGEWGAWDDGGFSEAGMLYHDGVFHCFYSGVKWEKLESIGYAYSFDGYNFIKYSGNPVAPRENSPDTSAFAEIHTLYEPPFHYVYNTQRYYSRRGEYLGVQILVNQRPFSLRMPVLNIESLEAGKTTSLDDSPPISLGNITRLALTAECNYNNDAGKPIVVHVRSSYDGLNYDTTDLYSFANAIEPGRTARKTVELEPKVQFIKVLVENPLQSHSVSDVKIIATLGG
ncbi:hypothetical protein ACFL1G_07510 [Planctomycetota bacterium]